MSNNVISALKKAYLEWLDKRQRFDVFDHEGVKVGFIDALTADEALERWQGFTNRKGVYAAVSRG